MTHRDDRDRERFHGSYDPEREMPDPDRGRGGRYQSDAYRSNFRDSRFDDDRERGFMGRMRHAVDRMVDRFTDRDEEDDRDYARRHRNTMPDRADAYTRGSGLYTGESFRDRDYDYNTGYSGRTMSANEDTYGGGSYDRDRSWDRGEFSNQGFGDRGDRNRWSSDRDRNRWSNRDDSSSRSYGTSDYGRGSNRFATDYDRGRYESGSYDRDRDRSDVDRSLWRSSERPDYLGRNATPWQMDDRYGRQHEDWAPNRDRSSWDRDRDFRDRTDREDNWRSRDRNFGYDRDRDEEWRSRSDRFDDDPFDRDRFRR